MVPVWVWLLAMWRGELSAVIAQLMSKCLSSRCKFYWGVKEMPSLFLCSPVIRECAWKKPLLYLMGKGLWVLLEGIKSQLYIIGPFRGYFRKWSQCPTETCKGTFFPMKSYKRAPLIWATPMFIVYLHCFWWNNFLKTNKSSRAASKSCFGQKYFYLNWR